MTVGDKEKVTDPGHCPRYVGKDKIVIPPYREQCPRSV